MSIETTCKNCGAEYDARRDGCPACTIEIEMREKAPPYRTWTVLGWLPFEIHGERFAVTRIPCALNDESQWRVTHVSTGAGVPKTDAKTKEVARDIAKAVLAEVGPEKLKVALAKIVKF